MISIITYSQLTDPTAMLVAGAFLGMFVNGMMGGYGALMAEAYPTEARATAQNVLFNLGRAVGGFGPVVVGAIVSAYSFSIAIAFLAVIYVIDMVATVFLVPRIKRQRIKLSAVKKNLNFLKNIGVKVDVFLFVKNQPISTALCAKLWSLFPILKNYRVAKRQFLPRIAKYLFCGHYFHGHY